MLEIVTEDFKKAGRTSKNIKGGVMLECYSIRFPVSPIFFNLSPSCYDKDTRRRNAWNSQHTEASVP